MITQIINKQGDYIVEIFSDHEQYGLRRWYPLINFGDHQGDAKLFKLRMVENYDDGFLIKMAKKYQSDVKYCLYMDGNSYLKIKKQ